MGWVTKGALALCLGACGVDVSGLGAERTTERPPLASIGRAPAAEDMLDGGVAGGSGAPGAGAAAPTGAACGPVGTVCADATCRQGVQRDPSTCDAAGRCVPGRVVRCRDQRCADARTCVEPCDDGDHESKKKGPDPQPGCG
jgi:hypothetical protein